MQRCSQRNKSKLLVLVIACALMQKVHAQQKNDNDLMFGKPNDVAAFETKRKVDYLFKGRNAFVKYNPVSLVFGGLLYVYQKTISTQIGAACPYDVNCSNFSRQCIRQYGILRGIPLTADRLTRCTRLASFDMIKGVDYNSRTGKIFDHPNDYSFKHPKHP